MDGAIILASDASRIARANVHLVPDPNVPTSETGTRHRTAERVARSIDVPVITVSEDMSIIAVYMREREAPARGHPPAAQPGEPGTADARALQDPPRRGVRSRCPRSRSKTSSRCATCCRVLQRAEMVRRIAEEIEGYIVELGVDGRLVRLQLEELLGGIEDDRRLVVLDYFTADEGHWRSTTVMTALGCARHRRAARPASRSRRPSTCRPRGSRPRRRRAAARVPAAEQDPSPARAGHRERRRAVRQLAEDHAGHDRRSRRCRRRRRRPARAIKDGLSRLAETSILDRYS